MTRKINSTSDLIEYQRTLVRTGDFEPLGLAQKISIGPSDHWNPADFAADPYIRMYGRFVDLRRNFLPIAQSRDHSMVLATAPLAFVNGKPGLPDVPDPAFVPADWTPDEVQKKVARDPAKDRPGMIAQRLTDRCEQYEGRPSVLTGTNFLVFQPVLRVAFQPQLKGRLVADAWLLTFAPQAGQHPTMLVDHKTGEVLFLFGRHEIETPATNAGGERWADGPDPRELRDAAAAAMRSR